MPGSAVKAIIFRLPLGTAGMLSARLANGAMFRILAIGTLLRLHGFLQALPAVAVA